MGPRLTLTTRRWMCCVVQDPAAPKCILNAAVPNRQNGCPMDAAVGKKSKSFPACLAKNEDGDHRWEPMLETPLVRSALQRSVLKL